MAASARCEAMRAFATWPPRGSPLGLASWAREMGALARCLAAPPDYPGVTGLARGDGRAVLVLPGFLTNDWMTARLRGFLRRLGYDVAQSELLFNAGPTRSVTLRLEDRLAGLARARKGPVSVVGQSLGGVFARVLARRNPDLVDRVVTLCSPLRFPVVTPLQPFVAALQPFHDREWLASAGDIAAPLPVPVTAIYTRSDGMVDWRQCVQDASPGAVNVEVAGAHSTIGSNPAAQLAVAKGLAAA